MGEEITGLESLFLFVFAVRLSEEEEAAESPSIRRLTRLIIFLAAETIEDKRNTPKRLFRRIKIDISLATPLFPDGEPFNVIECARHAFV